MIRFTLLFITTLLFCKEDFTNSFITQYEYGKMLYNNPRGISCTKCHGEDAKGKSISSFIHKSNKKRYNCTIETEDITNISYSKFLQTLDPKLEKPKKKFTKKQKCEKLTYGNSMPTYFLTPEELKSIYFYLTNRKKYE
ncbi:c-type cytochrome [Arcobacteraceae bacterium]|nr:c-type cytochrome [Arcobacteraceae bacterium]